MLGMMNYEEGVYLDMLECASKVLSIFCVSGLLLIIEYHARNLLIQVSMMLYCIVKGTCSFLLDDD